MPQTATQGSTLIAPHGGTLVDRTVSGDDASALAEEAGRLPRVKLTEADGRSGHDRLRRAVANERVHDPRRLHRDGRGHAPGQRAGLGDPGHPGGGDAAAGRPPGAGGVGTPVRGGITYREAHLGMEILAKHGVVSSLEVVEVNPGARGTTPRRASPSAPSAPPWARASSERCSVHNHVEGVAMGQVRVDLNISLDGYATTTDQTPENPIGKDWNRLVAAYVATRTFRERVLGQSGQGTTGLDNDYAAAYFEGVGAEIMGAGMFGLHAHPGDPDWQGWWGPNPPFGVPVFVLTHEQRLTLEMDGGTTFHFVQISPKEILARAQEVAGDLDVRIGGGAPAKKPPGSAPCQQVGGVKYGYGIGQLEVTVDQWVAFLNTVDPAGPQPAQALQRHRERDGLAQVRPDRLLRRRRAPAATTRSPRRNGPTSPTASPTSCARRASSTPSTTASCSPSSASSRRRLPLRHLPRAALAPDRAGDVRHDRSGR